MYRLYDYNIFTYISLIFMVKVGVSLTTHGSQNGYIQDSAQSGAFGVADAALGGEKANQAIFDFGKVKFGYCNPYPP